MILSAISTPLVGLVDTALMGHLDDPAFLAATAAGATIFSVLFMSLNFLRMGTTGVAAQAYGSANNRNIVSALTQPVLIAGALALGLLLLQRPVTSAGLWLIGLSPDAAARAADYCAIRIWSAPMALVNFVIIGWLIGMQNARGPLAILLTINLVNAALDVLFVAGLNLDIRGVALATVCAELAGLGVGIHFVLGTLRGFGLQWSQGGSLTREGFRRLLQVNGNLFVRSIALMLTLAFVTAQGARFGNITLAANAILMHFFLFLSYALDGVAYAAEALTGKALGSGNRDGLRLAVRRCLNWTLLFAALFTLVYGTAGPQIIHGLTDLDTVRANAMTHLPWIIALPVLSAGAFLYDGVYVGTTRSREMRVVMVASAVLVFLPAWYLARPLGNHGLWLAFIAFMGARSLAMHLWYRRLLTTGTLDASHT